jgi:hypothetical protein
VSISAISRWRLPSKATLQGPSRLFLTLALHLGQPGTGWAVYRRMNIIVEGKLKRSKELLTECLCVSSTIVVCLAWAKRQDCPPGDIVSDVKL